MIGAEAGGWNERNQKNLLAWIHEIRAALERELARQRGERVSGPVAVHPPIDAGTRDTLPAAELITRAFGLSAFERHLLLLCAAAEFDGEVARLCAAIHGDPQQRSPTFGLALALLPAPDWRALSPDAPLRHYRLIDVLPGVLLTASPIRIEERVLHYLRGVEASEPRFAGLLEVLEPPPELPPSHQVAVRRLADAWCAPEGALPVQLCGAGAEDKRAIFAAASSALALRATRLSTHGLPSLPVEIDLLARLWARESALGAAALLIDVSDAGAEPGQAQAIAQLVEQTRGPLAVACRERRPGLRRGLVTIDVDKAPPREQAASWRRALRSLEGKADAIVDRLVSQFSLPSSTIETLARRMPPDAGDVSGEALWELCRVEARPQMDGQAQRVVAHATWADLVVPAFEAQLLKDIVVHARARSRVHDGWGLADGTGRGLSITALFSGASGTGKTLAAEVIAHELNLDLYRIDLSQAVSKYIGETEKNLRRVFDAAEEGGAILLFDEADALFGKRSDVKDSHDRYANIEVSYLLQRMEAYRGLAILTTNLKDALDSAFLRRIRFSVHFPFPTAEHRANIWRRAFPPGMPTAGLVYEQLARLNIPGGNIRNIAVYAAFLAADADSPVTMTHLLRAARVEFSKLERPLSEGDVRGWS